MSTTALVPIEQDVVGQQILARRDDFIRMLGGPAEAERFVQEAYAAYNANPMLRQCDPATLFGALYFAAQIDLPVGGPLAQFHLTPRNVWNPATRSKEWQVVPVIGYNGLITLAMNTGEYDAVEGKLVYSNDDFEEPYDDESGTHFKLRPARGDRGELVGVVGRAMVKGADRSIIEYLDIDTIRARHRPHNWEKTPWKTDEAQMVKKTGVRRVSKYTAKSRASWRFALAMEADQALITVDDAGELQVQHDEPATEDWKSLIAATDDKAELEALWKRMVDPNRPEERSVIEEMRPLVAARATELTKDSRLNRPSAEEIAAANVGREPSEEEYERIANAEFDAALARGEARAA